MTRLAETAARFDRWAPVYPDCALQPLYQAAHRAVLATAERLGLRPGRLLDVGCGAGQFLAAAACRFPRTRLIGADLSAVMLSVATRNRQPAAAVDFVCSAVEHLPFADMTFDVVASTVSFRHWTDQLAGLREIHRVLAPGGCLILAEVFAPPSRKWTDRLRGTPPLPHPLTRPQLSTIGLDIMTIDCVAGPGFASAITIVAARRRH